MGRLTSFKILLQFILLSSLSCSSLSDVQKDYQENRQENFASSKRTMIFILVDGLPVYTTTELLAQGKLPEIQHFFLSNNAPLYKARTGFPSLTYPGITSLLTEKSVDQHGIFGNTIVTDRGFLNFEVPRNYPLLNQRIQSKNIFSRLKAKKQNGVSFDFSFFADTVAHTFPTDSNVALGILHETYNIPDRRQIKSLDYLLTHTEPEEWPEFIFIHLIGLDFNSHDHGPESPQAKNYLQKLDSQLAPIFKTLQTTEQKKKRQIITMLSADHGFDELVTARLDIETAIRKQDRNITVLNEGRFAGIYFPSESSEASRSQFLSTWVQNSNIDIVAVREGDQVFVKSSSLEMDFTYVAQKCFERDFAISISGKPAQCLENIVPSDNDLFYPYFVANLSQYFQSENHPSALIIPKPGISFKEKYLGQHGGPTPREIFVPLFIRGASLGDPRKIPAQWELLRFL